MRLIARRDAVRTPMPRRSRCDVFVTLGACGAAPVGLGMTAHHHECRGVIARMPALTLPLLTDEGMPVGLQLLGSMDKDAALFELAAGGR